MFGLKLEANDVKEMVQSKMPIHDDIRACLRTFSDDIHKEVRFNLSDSSTIDLGLLI